MKGYTTLQDVSNYLLIDIEESQEAQVEAWIEAVERYIDHYTGRDFSVAGVSATTRYYDGNGLNSLTIDPAVQVVSVKLSPTSDALATDNYLLYPANKLPKNKITLRYLKFPEGLQNIVVNARFGLEAIPEDIQLAATVLVGGIINSSWNSEGEVESMSIGRYSVTYSTPEQKNDFKQVQDILDFNKRYHF